MMGLVRQWLLGVTAAALVLALAEALAPEGGAKKVCRMTGGLALLLAALGPVVRLDEGTFAQAVDRWRESTQGYGQALQEQKDLFYLAIIEEETAAYVMDKAKEFGFECQAEVTYGYDEDGVPRPWEVTARGSWTQGQQERLSQALEEELGIPAQRQFYHEEMQP